MGIAEMRGPVFLTFSIKHLTNEGKCTVFVIRGVPTENYKESKPCQVKFTGKSKPRNMVAKHAVSLHYRIS